MTQCIISVLIHLLIALSYYARDDISDGLRGPLVIGLLGFIALSVIGLVGYSATRKKAFAVMAMIGYGVFVPIGLIGVFGVMKLMKADMPAAAANGTAGTAAG